LPSQLYSNEGIVDIKEENMNLLSLITRKLEAKSRPINNFEMRFGYLKYRSADKKNKKKD
jgi:hypothetical protein